MHFGYRRYSDHVPSMSAPPARRRAMPAPVHAVSGHHHHTHTLAPVSVSALRSKATHVRVRQRLSPEARCQVAASCRQWQGRTGACRAPLRAVSRSVGASSLRRDDAEGCCTRDREREREEERERKRWCGLKTRDATNKEGGRERVERAPRSVAPCHCVET